MLRRKIVVSNLILNFKGLNFPKSVQIEGEKIKINNTGAAKTRVVGSLMDLRHALSAFDRDASSRTVDKPPPPAPPPYAAPRRYDITRDRLINLWLIHPHFIP